MPRKERERRYIKSIKGIKLPPRVPGGVKPNLPRFFALVDEIDRIIKEDRQNHA